MHSDIADPQFADSISASTTNHKSHCDPQVTRWALCGHLWMDCMCRVARLPITQHTFLADAEPGDARPWFCSQTINKCPSCGLFMPRSSHFLCFLSVIVLLNMSSTPCLVSQRQEGHAVPFRENTCGRYASFMQCCWHNLLYINI